MCKIQRMIYDLFKFIFSVQTLVHLLGEPLTEIASQSLARQQEVLIRDVELTSYRQLEEIRKG